MIPRTIHYCWFGRNPLPESAKRCIASWQRYLPDYEIIEWNEDNFDVNIIPYTAEAYKAKKYAFVSDYARFWVLYKYGGLYFDTDVEIVRKMDDIIARGAFMGCEKEVRPGARPEQLSNALGLGVNPGLGLGALPGLDLYAEILGYYKDLHYLQPDGRFSGETVVKITTRLLCGKGLKAVRDVQEVAGVWIYPKEYFCPKDYKTGVMTITNNTVSIHHYDASWLPWYVLLEQRICNSLHIPYKCVLYRLFYTKTAWYKILAKVRLT